tara:strand:+ start:535 stop:888 length:354 start_codon:yes stop_codon:yes gene_type:complete
MSNLSAQTINNIQEVSNKAFIKRLMDGDLSLVKTYWLYGVVGSILMNIVLLIPLMAESLPLLYGAIFVSLAYAFVVLTGIWNSATKHHGYKFWAILAKIIVIFNGLYIFMAFVSFFE